MLDRVQEIAKLEAQLAELKALDQERKKFPERDIAEFLHAKTCGYNHTDGCAWNYESDNWDGSTHKIYLLKAQKLLRILESSSTKSVFDTAREIIETLA